MPLTVGIRRRSGPPRPSGNWLNCLSTSGNLIAVRQPTRAADTQNSPKEAPKKAEIAFQFRAKASANRIVGWPWNRAKSRGRKNGGDSRAKANSLPWPRTLRSRNGMPNNMLTFAAYQTIQACEYERQANGPKISRMNGDATNG